MKGAFPLSAILPPDNKLRRAGELIRSGRIDVLGDKAKSSLKRAAGKFLAKRIERPEETVQDAPWFQTIYSRPVSDLKTVLGDAYAGIYSPGYTDATVNKYLHEQFRDGADNHAQRYEHFDMYERHLKSEFQKFAYGDESLTVLDIGSGAGNTVIPLLRLLPQSRLIASELSPEMLRELKKNLETCGLQGKCSLLQLNAEHLSFVDNSFDLITGGGILHHLFYPHATINHCGRILKPGGRAIFFEPMKSGNRVLQLLFETMLETCADQLPAAHASYLQELLVSLDNQSVPDKENSIFKALDDKWMFSRPQIVKWAKDAGFEKVEINAINGTDGLLEKQARHIFDVYAGLPYDLLPQTAKDLVKQMEEKMPDALKESILVEATIVLTKGGK